MNDINSSICFETEFHAYNLGATGVLVKRYVRPSFGASIAGHGEANIRDDQLHALSQALESPCLSAIETGRFSLYDVSFRGEANTKAVSISFIDTRDGEYLSSSEMFGSFRGFDADPLIKATRKLEKSVFPSGVVYNPNWMFGLLFERSLLVSVKAYMRFDLGGTLGHEGRREVINRVTRAHDAPQTLTGKLLDHTQWLEDCGLFLRFFGIDQKSDGNLRYKLYYRTDGHEDADGVRHRLSKTTEDPAVRAGIEEMFRRHHSGMWGLGISVGELSEICGFQTYFYPYMGQ